jgi:hypothetical protein
VNVNFEVLLMQIGNFLDLETVMLRDVAQNPSDIRSRNTGLPSRHNCSCTFTTTLNTTLLFYVRVNSVLTAVPDTDTV